MPRIRACDACYKKKIQCIIRQPGAPCNWCRHQGLACAFTRERLARKEYKFKPSDIQELFTRVEQLESALAQATSSPHSRTEVLSGHAAFTSPAAVGEGQSYASRSESSIDLGGQLSGVEPTEASPPLLETVSPPSNVPSWQALRPRSHLGQKWFYKGTAILSDEGLKWISSRTGEQVTFDKFPLVCHPSDTTLASALPTLQLRVPFQELCSMPSKSVAERVSHIVLGTSFALAFPVLDRVLFEETLRMAYEAPDNIPSSPPHILARACILAAVSIASRFEHFTGAFSPVDGDMCAAKAQCLLQHINGDESLVTLQTILMLQRHQTFTGQWQSADELHSAACRMVCRLGGHIYQPPPLDNLELSLIERRVHHTRNLFWLCYSLDKDICLRSGRPPILTEDYCDLMPGSGENRSPAVESGQSSGADCSVYNKLVLYAPAQLGLGYLKERVCRLLYSALAIKSTDGEHLLHIRQLDAELETWRSSIPRNLRPSLSISTQYPLLVDDQSNPHKILRLNLQLEYHYLMIAIHATVRRCRASGAESDSVPNDLHSVLHSSTDIALEASRSTLLILKDCITTMVIEGSHHIVFYAAVATMSLFTNILVHLTAAETQEDAELLDLAAGIMRRIPLRAPTQRETEHVQQMVAFVMELARLGSCAIAKAMK